jgi:hypothetical protein
MRQKKGCEECAKRNCEECAKERLRRMSLGKAVKNALRELQEML